MLVDGRGSCDPWVGKIPWRRAWQPTPVFLPGESHGQRSLVGYSPAATAKSLQSCLTLCDPTDVAHQAHLSVGFSRQEYWSGLPCPSPGNLPDPGIEPTPALKGVFFTTNVTWEAVSCDKPSWKRIEKIIYMYMYACTHVYTYVYGCIYTCV